jgi:hypothetical protein
MLNPYHNLDHELTAVYFAHCCSLYPKLTYTSKVELYLAALFHDHNHSGGKTSDKENVERALNFIDGSAFRDTIAPIQNVNLDAIKGIIRCTEYTDGKFPVEPTTRAERCMRDADLMSIYQSYPGEVICGLFAEFGIPYGLVRAAAPNGDSPLERNKTFLREAPMFTEHGYRMKDYHLERQLVVLDGYFQ